MPAAILLSTTTEPPAGYPPFSWMDEVASQIIAAVEAEMAAARDAVQINGIIERVLADHQGLSRKEVTEQVVQMVLFKGAAAIWTEPERGARHREDLEFDLDAILLFPEL